MHHEMLGHMNPTGDLNIMMIGARLMIDLGISEAKEAKMRFAPGCIALNRSSSQRVYLVAPHLGEYPGPRNFTNLFNTDEGSGQWITSPMSQDELGWDLLSPEMMENLVVVLGKDRVLENTDILPADGRRRGHDL